MSARRASALALGFSLAGVVLMLLVVVMAARSGPSGVIHGTPHDDIFHAPHPTISSSSGQGHRGPDSTTKLPQGSSSLPAADVIGTVLRLALFAWLLVLAIRGVRWLVEDLAARRNREPRPDVVDFDVLDDPTPLVDEIRRDANDQLELLLGGEPRNAIVAAWDRFEEQAERVGAARKLWETSSEFTLRLLDAVAAAPPAVARLAALYREARFSEHEITEDNRGAAVAALHEIHASIGIHAGASR